MRDSISIDVFRPTHSSGVVSGVSNSGIAHTTHRNLPSIKNRVPYLFVASFIISSLCDCGVSTDEITCIGKRESSLTMDLNGLLVISQSIAVNVASARKG